jgi:transcriptional regulator with XRE-family HTH domain
VRARGRIYPDLEKLQRALELRAWTYLDLATKAGIGRSTAWRVVAGKRVAISAIDRVSQALLDNPPGSTATGAFLSKAAS